MNHAQRVLEFDLIRQRLAGECETALAAERAAEMEPEFDEEEVWRLQSLTKEAMELLAGLSIPSLGAVRDQRQAADRAKKGGSIDGATIFSIGAGLQAMRETRAVVWGRRDVCANLWHIAEGLPELKALEDKILFSVEADGEVLDSASPELARLRKTKASAAQRIADRIQSYTTGKNRDLLSDPIVTQRDGRYVVPLKAENKGKLRGIIHDTSSSGQTVYIEPEEIVQLGNSLREAEVAERVEVARILTDLSKRVGNEADAIIGGIESASALDLILAKGRLGYRMKGTPPIRSAGHRIFIANGNHPLLDPEKAVPLTLDIGKDFDGVLITGPNTGGKTVAIKTVGLFVLMAQCGMVLPAHEVRLGVFTQVWADIGDEQSLQQSLSTFSAHIKNIGEALTKLKPGGLVLLDEVGAGTDPAEGAALAKALLLAFQAGGAKIMASTHYGELKIFAYNSPGFTNAAMEFDVKSLRPTYRLIVGAPGASHALMIAQRHGIPKPIIDQAREGVGIEQQDVARMLEKLEIAQRQAQRAQGEADQLAARLRKVESETQKKLDEAAEIKRTAKAKAAEALEEALREIRLEATDIFDMLKGSADQKTRDEARERLRTLQDAGSDLAAAFKPKEKARVSSPVVKGASVKMTGYSQVGVVLTEPRDGKAQVQIGLMKMTVAVGQLEVVAGQPDQPKAAPRKSMTLQKAQTAKMEIDMRGVRMEDAELMLSRFIDEALLGGLPNVRIVHGKGEGILRKMTQDLLKRHKSVVSYRDGEAAEGGQGVTIAEF
ncbi:MAG: endonuclease MutS2 [Fimbriimonadaceae bacterium]|nr:endonuclease MutS2 [Fimbriimonadaceae bacterium]